jgi:hypothetical protein
MERTDQQRGHDARVFRAWVIRGFVTLTILMSISLPFLLGRPWPIRITVTAVAAIAFWLLGRRWAATQRAINAEPLEDATSPEATQDAFIMSLKNQPIHRPPPRR